MREDKDGKTKSVGPCRIKALECPQCKPSHDSIPKQGHSRRPYITLERVQLGANDDPLFLEFGRAAIRRSALDLRKSRPKICRVDTFRRASAPRHLVNRDARIISGV